MTPSALLTARRILAAVKFYAHSIPSTGKNGCCCISNGWRFHAGRLVKKRYKAIQRPILTLGFYILFFWMLNGMVLIPLGLFLGI
jgi:hypothetical protein